MSKAPNLIDEIISNLKEMADQNRKEMAKTYYPTCMKVIGVTVPDIRLLIKSISPELKNMSVRDKIRFAKDLINTKIFECQQIAYEILGRDKKLMKEISSEDIKDLDKHQDNWVSVDTYSALILGVGWREAKISDEEILQKTKSDDYWIRRQALVATLGWNQKARGGSGNTEKTLMICELFVNDHEDMITKALSWALRELSKTDHQSVTEFMKKHDQHLAGRVRREVWNKLETGLKN